VSRLRDASARMRVASLRRALFDRLLDARMVDSATAAAFWSFLSILPLAAFAAMLVAHVAVADASVFDAIFAYVPESSRELFARELAIVASHRTGTFAPATMVAFVWLASSGFHALFDAFDAVTRCRRSWVRKRVRACAVCVACSLALAAVAVAGGVARRTFVVAASHGIGSVLIAFAIELAMIAALFAIGVAPEARAKMPILPGALVAVALHMILAGTYVLYVRSLGTGSAYEAGLATIGVTMTTVLLFTLSLLAGVTVNAVLGTDVATSSHGGSS
jgi:uncharacterized BrkB/YihY/UPF0761 family membrane protein